MSTISEFQGLSATGLRPVLRAHIERDRVPTIFRIRGFRFFFYSNEGRPREPPHVHIEQGNREATFGLRPEVHLANNDGFGARALREVLRRVEANRERIERAWHDFFG